MRLIVWFLITNSHLEYIHAGIEYFINEAEYVGQRLLFNIASSKDKNSMGRWNFLSIEQIYPDIRLSVVLVTLFAHPKVSISVFGIEKFKRHMNV